jgi:hypothetical protein
MVPATSALSEPVTITSAIVQPQVLSNPSRVSSKGLISALWTTTISGDEAVHMMPDIAMKINTNGAINPLLNDWLITRGIILFLQIARHETAEAPAY